MKLPLYSTCLSENDITNNETNRVRTGYNVFNIYENFEVIAVCNLKEVKHVK